MPAGKMREILAAEWRQAIDDGAGNVISGPYTEKLRMNASVVPVRGGLQNGEVVLASRLQGIQPYVIVLRWHMAAADINTDWRLRDLRSGMIYEIKTCTTRHRRDFIDIMAVSGVAG